mmetsp:Transcript_18190/g.54376  ORF Transcript_18190/g.54376 Transcript_18190/m.54376 type:complete len:297 (-) Transcript_18190:57-947(-)
MVDVDASESEFWRGILTFGGAEPLAEELGDVRIARRGVEDPVGAVPHPEHAQRVAVDRRHALRQHVEPRVVLGEAPDLEHFDHVVVADWLARVKLPPCHLVRNDPRRLDVGTLRVALLPRLLVDFVQIHAVQNGELGEFFPNLGVHLDAATIGPAKLCQTLNRGITAWQTHARRLVGHWASQDVEVAPLILPEEVRRLTMLQGFANRLAVLILLVPVKRLAARRLRIRRVADARLGRKPGDEVVRGQVEFQAGAALAVRAAAGDLRADRLALLYAHGLAHLRGLRSHSAARRCQGW